MGNKIDLEKNVNTKEAEVLSHNEGALFFEVSSKTGENIFKSLYESIAHLQYFTKFKKNKNQIVNELMQENGTKLEDDNYVTPMTQDTKDKKSCNC